MTDGREITSVLLLRLSSFGDIVLTEPVVSSLRDALPGVEIGFAVKSGYADLVSSHPDISRVHTLDEQAGDFSALAREIRDARYSAVVDLHRSMRTVRLSRASGAPVRTSYVKRELADTLRVRVLRRSFRASRLLVRRYLDALRPLGVEAHAREPRLYVSDADAERGVSLLAERGLNGTGFAAVVPGSTWPTKRWPAERFAALSAGIVANLGLPVLVLGSSGERELCEFVERNAGRDVVSIAGETTLGRAAAVISRASLLVGNDSGPMHMSMALGVPTVGIFGPTDPRQFDFAKHALVYRDLPCSACSFYGSARCRLGHSDCMRRIGHDEVLEATASLSARREVA